MKEGPEVKEKTDDAEDVITIEKAKEECKQVADDQAEPATHRLLDIQSQEVDDPGLLEDDEEICLKCRTVLKHRHFEAYTDPLGRKWPHREWCRRCCIMHSGNMTFGEAIHLILKEIDQAAILNKACLKDTLEQMKTQVDDTLSRLEISRGHEMRIIEHYAKQVSDAHKEIQLLCAPLANQVSDAHKDCLLYTSPSPRDFEASRMPSSA